MKDFSQLPQPPEKYLCHGVNNLTLDETSYNRPAMQREYSMLYDNCNEEQKVIFHDVMHSVENKAGGVFFVYGSGGCGKTYLWRTIICKLRCEGKIVLPVASSGIAATLLPGGRTAHSRFKIPINLDEYSFCNINHNSDIAHLIRNTSLIIWDEAPMQHRYSFECLDRSLRDLMKSVDSKFYHMPFGGITVFFGGDFRQILPVITYGSRSDVVSACITRSKVWNMCEIYVLKQNMRLNNSKCDKETELLKQFAQWILDVGNGTVPCPEEEMISSGEFGISIPTAYCNMEDSNSVEKMILSIFPGFLENFRDSKYISERAILTPTNQTVSYINSKIVEMMPGEEFCYLSVDRADDFGGTDAELDIAFPTEYLNSLSIPGLPNHELKLKEGVVVMLMRNLNQTLGLCNGTRMIVTKCFKYSVQCEVISGTFVGTRHFIPRMECCPSDSKLPFKLIRKQMPLQICYAMTINKSQGQSLEMVGLYLPKAVFTHGQLYVAISRVTSPKGLRIFIDDEMGECTTYTDNVVYKEVFYNLPCT